MSAGDAEGFWRKVQRITKLPLSNPAALYLWLPKPDMYNYIKEDIELRQMVDDAGKCSHCKRDTKLARQVTAFADRRLLAAAMPGMVSYLESLPGSRRTTDKARSKKWTSVLAYAFQTMLSILGILPSG